MSTFSMDAGSIAEQNAAYPSLNFRGRPSLMCSGKRARCTSILATVINQHFHRCRRFLLPCHAFESHGDGLFELTSGW